LAENVIEKALDLLNRAMEKDAMYLNPNCNLALLSQHTGLPAKTISAVLNQHLKKSFNEYVNGYRVEAFQKKILEPGQEHFTITGIAFDCGFNSQATFQRTFKDVTGMSPTEWRKSAQIRI
jgi:AraC-like DNA-binding protein